MEKLKDVHEKLVQLRRAAQLQLAAGGMKQAVKQKAAEVMVDVDLGELFELVGAGRADEAAQEAMRALVAEQMAECAIGAMREARKRRIRVGAAAVIIAAASR